VKVLVTGSAGFIGKHTVAALVHRGDTVIEVDRKTGIDLARDDLKALDDDPDRIIHLAGSCSTSGSIRDALGTFDDTVDTTARLLGWYSETGIPVIVTSSVKARDGRTPYGAAKRMVETWALELRATYDWPIIVNRPGTVYGPGQEGSPESGWIAWFLRAKAEGLPVVVNGTGGQVRDLLHVDDYVRLLLMQIDQPDLFDTGVPWDVGGGSDNAVTVKGMAEYLGLDYTHGPARYGDADWYEGQNRVPGWKPAIRWRESGMFR
jgi:CDP-paratose 2-epimerase